MLECEVCDLWYCGTDQPRTTIKRLNESDRRYFWFCSRCIRKMKVDGKVDVRPWEPWQWQEKGKPKVTVYFIHIKGEGFKEISPEMRPPIGVTEQIALGEN